MTDQTRTYTTEEARVKLGFARRVSVYALKRRYPHALVIVHHGKLSPRHLADATLWDADRLDAFLEWRKAGKGFKDADNSQPHPDL